MTYIVVSENEIVKAEMERPESQNSNNMFAVALWAKANEDFQAHCLSLPRIAIQGKHNWKVWQEVVLDKDFRFSQTDCKLGREGCICFPYLEKWCPDAIYIATPIQPTPEGEKVEERKNIALLINTYDKGMIEYFRRHNYRLMYELWNQFKSEILNNDNPQTP